MREITIGPRRDAQKAVSYWTQYKENCSEPFMSSVAFETPAATHKSKTLAGATSNNHLPRVLAQRDRSPEDGQRGMAWLQGSGTKYFSVCQSSIAGLLKAGPDQKLDKLPRSMACLACS